LTNRNDNNAWKYISPEKSMENACEKKGISTKGSPCLMLGDFLYANSLIRIGDNGQNVNVKMDFLSANPSLAVQDDATFLL
jgi:hypothetical protein